jgi:hypothetical protein
MSSHFVRMGIAFGSILVTGIIGACTSVGWYLGSVDEDRVHVLKSNGNGDRALPPN